ncbi:MAG TPA: hypothetical protein VGO47_06185, partial [Chlamydiales bacterium]|nr:hypothetical protein [Chlamydiales bacterium]
LSAPGAGATSSHPLETTAATPAPAPFYYYLINEHQHDSLGDSDSSREYSPSEDSSDDDTLVSSTCSTEYWNAKCALAKKMYSIIYEHSGGIRVYLLGIYAQVERMIELEDDSYSLTWAMSDAWNRLEFAREALDINREIAYIAIKEQRNNAPSITEEAIQRSRDCYFRYHVADKQCQYLRAALCSSDPNRWLKGFLKWFREIVGDEAEIVEHY